MKKILIFTLILSQCAIGPSWSMGEKKKSPAANPVNEQNQTVPTDTMKLDSQDRDTMNQTTGFSGQTNSTVDLETDAETSQDQENLDMKNQSNLPGETGKTTSGAVTTGEAINSNQYGTTSQTGLTGQEKNSIDTQSTKSSGYVSPTGKSTTSNSY